MQENANLNRRTPLANHLLPESQKPISNSTPSGTYHSNLTFDDVIDKVVKQREDAIDVLSYMTFKL